MTAKELNAKMTARGIRLHGERVALAREKTIRKTAGGLFIPEIAQRDNQYASVVLIGDGAEVQKMGLQVGDSLYIPKYRPVDIKQRVGDETYWLGIMHFSEVYMSYAGENAELETGPPPDEENQAR